MTESCNQSAPELEWLPLLVPDMPSPHELLPWLERMHSARHYSNFGPLVRELESVFAQQFGIADEQLTTVANATQGLELVLQALDLAPSSRVLLPALTFVATATAVLRAGHQPVLADVDPQTWMLTPEIARAACEAMRIDAVLSVAAFGMPHDMQAWQQFERDTGLPVVIDAAAAYGSQWLKEAEGTLVFSLHTTKSLPAGEGGLVVSTRPGLAAKVRQLSNFGINLNPAVGMPVGALASLGSNAKMSEYHAAIGLRSLQKWELRAQQRRALQSELMFDLHQRSYLDLAGPRPRWPADGPHTAVRAAAGYRGPRRAGANLQAGAHHDATLVPAVAAAHGNARATVLVTGYAECAGTGADAAGAAVLPRHDFVAQASCMWGADLHGGSATALINQLPSLSRGGKVKTRVNGPDQFRCADDRDHQIGEYHPRPDNDRFALQ